MSWQEGHMGMFDRILGGAIGVEAAALLNSFIEKQGGLQNIASQFEKNGFGELPITADQISQALGSDKVKELAARLGLRAVDIVALNIIKKPKF
jgi:uncharacterized protein YidB (DUF937 family)